jgi:translation initiation factor eIF-2B subunit alpha
VDERIKHFSQLFRELEAEIGTQDLADLLLQALVVSIKAFKADDKSSFCDQFNDLVKIISNTEPRFGILIYCFFKLRKEFQNGYFQKLPEKKWKRVILKRVKEILREFRKEIKKLVENSDEIDVDGKTILIHDNSRTVRNVLAHYKKMGKKFKVIIAEQDYDKTHNNIERMHKLGIPFQVIPSYMLSHIHDTIDMVFFGGLTLKDTMNFVMNPGTHGIISEFLVEGTPVYMFINTTKFSLWKARKKVDVFMHKHKRAHHTKEIQYERVKYSHDRVPHTMFEKIITNKGAFTPNDLKKFFDKLMKKHTYDEVKEG